MTTRGAYNTLTPAGTTQAAAALINADTVMLTGGTAAQGAILPPTMDLNQEVIVVNGDASIEYFVYPQVGGKINNATANLGLLVPPNRAVRFRAINALDVIAFF